MTLWNPQRTKHYALTAGLLALALGLDRLAKIAAEAWLSGREPIRLFWDTVVFVLARNDGAFLGMGGDWPLLLKGPLLLGLPMLLCLWGLGWCWARESSLPRLAGIVCLVGGGMGNLLDRAFLDFQVVDFVNFGIGPLRTGIVNVADLFVTAGALWLVWLSFREKKGR